MSGRPGMLGWLVAHARREVDGRELEAYRRGAAAVYRVVDELEKARDAALLERYDAWTRPPALQRGLLCGWNARALQILGDAFIEGDYEADELTEGFVDAATCEEALRFYGQIGGWVSRAHQALDSETYLLDVDVPAALPVWAEAPPTEVRCRTLRCGVERLQRVAEASEVDTAFPKKDIDRKRAAQKIAQVRAEASAAAEYATALDGEDLPTRVLAEVIRHRRIAIERYYLLGQLMAWPELALHSLPKLQPASRKREGEPPPRLARPGEPGFDPWCLTDPRTKKLWKRMPAATRAIDRMWGRDPSPEATVDLKDEIDAALYRHEIAYEAVHYYACPWAAIYLVKRPVRIGGKRLDPMQQFTVDVGRHDRRGPYAAVIVGPFAPAGEVGYR